MIPLAGVIGWPIGHTRSPAIHNFWLARLGIAGHYVPLAVRPGDFEAVLLTLPKMGFRGLNVTIPYKETALALATSISDRAALIGAANTLVFREDGTIRADNTDGAGFLESLRQAVPDWMGRDGPALVLGAGGAARAVLSALLQAGVPEIRLANRTKQRAEILKDQFGARITVWDWTRLADGAAEAKTIVNATSLGMDGQPPLSVPLDRAPGDAVVCDLVYAPLRTGLLDQAEGRGLRTVDGLGMLLHQAVPGFEYWFEQRPEVDAALREAVLR